MLVLDGRVGDQEQGVEPVERMLQRRVIVVVGLANGCPSLGRKVQFFRMSRDEDEVLGRETEEKMLDGAAADASRGREDADFGAAHGGEFHRG